MKPQLTTTCACLPLPVGEGWGEGAQLACELETTIAANVTEILES